MKKNENWFKEAHDLGLKVNIWTVNTREDMQYCIDKGADFITTDQPELLQTVLKGNWQQADIPYPESILLGERRIAFHIH